MSMINNIIPVSIVLDARTEGYTYNKHGLNCVVAENAIEDLAFTDQFW